ncbi:ATP-binding protein [Sphingomonas sp. PWP1-2]|uniref:ATP-binding protein n=1 Tax=Sphingomonas sp. PWP1-2 TaxID=2804558 RepID=UPI003CEC4A25
MRVESISRPDAMSLLPPIALETGLLELFAPTRAPASTNTSLPRSEHAHLWRADAVHRAKNMAQLSTSFADVVDHPSRGWLPTTVITQARRLSRAYEELGVDAETQSLVPCAGLLIEIATRLTDIFGRSRRVAITISAEAVLLPPDVRRALVLMGSELVINALKYGYPTEVGGTILVSLAATRDEVELVVEDDGIGVVESYSAGNGGGLLEKLRAVLGATVTRTTGFNGHGFRVSVLTPMIASIVKS